MPTIGLGLGLTLAPVAAFRLGNSVPLPLNITPPTIQSPNQPALIGDALVCDVGAWNNMVIEYLFQWERRTGSSYAGISGADSSVYTVTGDDIGCDLRCLVVAVNEYGNSECAAEAVTVHASGGLPVSAVTPSIVGPSSRPYVGEVLEGNPGEWAPEAFEYAFQWRRRPEAGEWSEIEGGSFQNYTVSQADAGCELQVVVTAANSVGAGQAESSASSVVFGVPVNDGSMGTIAPSMIAAHVNPRLGETLVCDRGTWKYQEGAVFSYQWHRYESEGAYIGPIDEANSDSYAVTFEDLGRVVRCAVTAFNAAGEGDTREVSAGGLVWEAPICTGSPVLTTNGYGVVGDTIDCDPGSWEGFPTVEFEFRWYYGGSGEPLFGANGNQIDTTPYGIGNYQCRVKGVNGAGFEEVVSNEIYISEGDV